jgi:hypothetical protein
MAGRPDQVRNDRKNGVTKFCQAMEEYRRTEAGRVRTARELVDFFFPRTNGVANDQVFLHMPPEVRGPIISGWGVRGAKSALKDTDEKIRQVVQDALAAGDIDEAMFEEGITAQTFIDWQPLTEWWSFWRTGKLTGVAIQKALATARDLSLFDDRWFLQNCDGRGGKLKGTDTLCDTLSKDQIIAWMRKVHESGDGSPTGLVTALGWETVLAKTSQEALLFSLDAFAKKVGLVATVPGAATEMPGQLPGHDENIAVPDFPADLETPNLGDDTSATASWPNVRNGQMSTSDAPPSFGIIEEDTANQDKPKQPPPVPVRKSPIR